MGHKIRPGEKRDLKPLCPMHGRHKGDVVSVGVTCNMMSENCPAPSADAQELADRLITRLREARKPTTDEAELKSRQEFDNWRI